MKETRIYTMGARADRLADTRERITRCAKDLFLAEPVDDVTLARIAAAAGVSHQTVLNHFESKEGVMLAVAELFQTETVTARSQAEPGDVGGAIQALVGEYERMGDANFRWAATAEQHPKVADILELARRSHQDWIEATFGDRLATARTERRRAVLAIHAATDVYTWKLLRRDLGTSRSRTEAIMTDLVVGILEGTSR